jgi:hypothetical protein
MAISVSVPMLLCRYCLSAVVALAASTSYAAQLNFNTLAPNTWFDISGVLGSDGWTINDDGFAIANTTTLRTKGVVANGTFVCSPPCPDNGTTYLLAHGAGYKFTPLENVLFSLSSFDGSEAHQSNSDLWAAGIRVTGELAAGGTVVNDFLLDWVHDGPGGANDFQSFVLDGFTNLTSVSFQAINSPNGWNFFSIDNLNVRTNGVPEPNTLALLLAALVGVSWPRRSKQWIHFGSSQLWEGYPRPTRLKSNTSCTTAAVSTRHHHVCLNFSTRPFDPPRDRISVPRITIPPDVTRRTMAPWSCGRTIRPRPPPAPPEGPVGRLCPPDGWLGMTRGGSVSTGES